MARKKTGAFIFKTRVALHVSNKIYRRVSIRIKKKKKNQ